MAYCEKAEEIKSEKPGPWGNQVLAYHQARCALCQALDQIGPDGMLTEEAARKLGGRIYIKPGNKWVQIPDMKVAEIKGQEIHISD